MVPTAPDAILPAHSTPTPGAPDAVTAAHSAPTPDAPGAVTGAFSTPSPTAPLVVTQSNQTPTTAYLVGGADAGAWAGYYLNDPAGSFLRQQTMRGDPTRIMHYTPGNPGWQIAVVSYLGGVFGEMAVNQFMGQDVATPDLVTEWKTSGVAKDITVTISAWPLPPSAITPAHTTPPPSAPGAVTAAQSAATPDAPGAITPAASASSPEAPAAVTPAYTTPTPAAPAAVTP
jgi:hypothetical protein